MTRRTLCPSTVIVGCAALLTASLLFGRSSGTIPGHNGIPPNATTGYPSCGACHGSGRAGERGPVTGTFLGSASIRKSTNARFSFAIRSAVPGSRGGFALTTNGGSFQAVGNTQVGNGGRALSHTSSSARSWSFDFSSTRTGLHEWFAVGNTVDGDGKTKGDSWGFYGPDPSRPGTPFRVFVNDSQVHPYGQPCKGSGGHEPLLGAARNATRGQPFPVELHNVPPQSAALGLFGFSNTQYGPFRLPLALDSFGGTGCRLNAAMDIILPAATTGTGSGNGKATFGWVIPNLAAIQGLSIYCSALVVDGGANKLGLTNSGGVRAVIQ